MERSTPLTRRSPMPPGDPAKALSRRVALSSTSSAPLRASTLTRQPWSRKVPPMTERGPVAPVLIRPRWRDTIPPKVRKAVNARDGRWCLYCGRCFPDGGIHLHHRRLKQAGGSSAEHADCACAIVSVCWAHHGWFHDTAVGRGTAETEGFIIPAATEEPWRLSVLVHGDPDGGSVESWPTCEGGRDGWVFADPNGVAA